MQKDLPIYSVALEDYDMGLYAISLVDKPATESNFIYMSEDKPGWHFSDEEKGEVVGALLVPDKLIYRNVGGNEFYIKFSAEVIAQINERMQDTGFNKVFTVSHQMDANDAVKFLESWIKETEEDKSSAFGINEPIGTLFAKVKVQNELLKAAIKNGELNGFSIELDASIIQEKLEQQFKDIEKNKNKKDMDYKEIYENHLEVNDTTLLFNGEMNVGSVVFELSTETVDEKEKQNLKPFTGEFELEHIRYKIENGLILEKEDVEQKLSEKIDELSEKLKSIEQKLSEIRKPEDKDELLETVNAISQKLEEQALLAKQKEAEEQVEEIKDKYEFSAEAYKEASSWISRFKENK